jgi:hypothetical protein
VRAVGVLPMVEADSAWGGISTRDLVIHFVLHADGQTKPPESEDLIDGVGNRYGPSIATTDVVNRH